MNFVIFCSYFTLVLIFCSHRYFKRVLLLANALDKLPIFFESYKDVQSENLMFTFEICKDWDEVHQYEHILYLDCPMSKTPHFELELHNPLEPSICLTYCEIRFTT